jgi:hypothetical protein
MKLVIFISITMLAMGCSSSGRTDKNGIPVEMINNPSTASNPGAQQSAYPVMTFESTECDFGDLIDGQNVEHTYKFKNTGTTNLLIDRCDVTCGCTTPKFSKEPIKPGESSEIKVGFNSTGKSGVINKNVVVWANIKDQKIELHFKANVNVAATK